ncbi:MAG: excinuclease ABC subunit A [Gemmatimonadetes bacterium]|nr:MAG: excinuclease ABC subunit A [Gemmatimonadetes bacterium 13_1_40CM_3_66_12]OLD88301.1 MAG: excinuclease ABC subunit A [Gemmatimonadetes bacterium 13_1_20CM_4_66_11]PYP95664.1 MAG: excinuclease ABC subunit A [Gemmatimonadota bacterium]
MRHPPERVILRNVRQHNLKGITVEFPRRALSVVTGPSGSGKSSLAFDTLYAEGQRRYIESLSTYAKQFLERMPKPLVDAMEGLSPAVAIEQKNPTTSSRSTVGTATEIADFLRLLWARAGTQACLHCGKDVKRDTVQEVVDAVREAWGVPSAAYPVVVSFPLPASAHRPDVEIAAQLRAAGFVRAQVDGDTVRLDEVGAEERVRAGKDVLVLVDRVALTEENRGRLADAVATAFSEGEGIAVALNNGDRRRFSEHPACSACGCAAPVLTPTLFSFNNPRGACPACNGFGAVLEYDESLILPDPRRSLVQGAVDPWTKPRYEGRRRLLRETARARGIDLDAPWQDIPARERHFLLHNKVGRYLGIFPFLERLEEKRYKQYIRVFLRQYQLAKTCPGCGGARLKPEALAVRVAGKTIAQVAALTAADLTEWLEHLELPTFQQTVANHVLEELRARVSFVNDVGLGYLTLDRQTRTLSGGEAQRIALSNALGSHLVDTLYVLDEPSIGLHPADMDRLLGLLRRLADAGNTVVVVEHDPAAMAAASWMVELGPASGDAGGQLVYQGPAAAVREAGTLTGQYLSGEKRIGVPSARRPAVRWLDIKGARLHNLKGVDVRIPVGTLTAVTGVSGSGKSTLVHDVLYRQLESRLRGEHSAKQHLGEPVGEVTSLKGWEHLEDVVLIDQAPIGRTPRSNPVTYVKAFDELRALFANEALARARGYEPSTFSFNVAGGRCEACEGAGHVLIEMVFLANVFVPCEVCGGSRFKREVLDVKLQGASIARALEWTVDEAIRRLHRHARLARCLWYLQQVGLGYLRLGQPATTLSGGEAQRLKIARELARAKGGRRLYILDEPTTGLHLDDVRVLCRVLDRLVDAGHTVLVIEHHLDVIKRADWVIDLGPGAGDQGGRIVAAGTPEDVAQIADSVTGRYLRDLA